MKRLHVSVAVTDLEGSVRFYTTLFGTGPTVRKADYAKWMLDEPRVNFAIEARGRTPGVDHLGIQAEDEAELAELYARIEAAEAPVLAVGETVCCYARSEKSWVLDPQGVPWEAFLTTGESDHFGDGDAAAPTAQDAKVGGDACCVRPRG